MSYNGSGTFNINTAGQPVVTGTVISSTAFNALTADLATGLSTAVTKDGQTATTARIPFAQGISSTLTTDATSTTTGSIITAGGISAQKAVVVGTLLNISAAGAGQIKFPATQNASADANTLDDYEQGSFTPGVSFGGASVGVTYGGSNAGNYTKIGDRVIINGYLQVTNKGSSTGTALITGLPFTVTNVGTGSTRTGNLASITAGVQIYANGSATTVAVEQLNGAVLTDANFGSGNDVIIFSLSYN